MAFSNCNIEFDPPTTITTTTTVSTICIATTNTTSSNISRAFVPYFILNLCPQKLVEFRTRKS